MNSAPNPYFQVGIDVRDQPCLVIGGGAEAADKGRRLLEAGARITLVSPTLTPALEEWVTRGDVVHRDRPFAETDLNGVFLVVNTLAGQDLAQQLFDRARQDRFLLNNFDQPSLSNFGMVALVAPGHLRLSVSTSNTSPALAGRLRRDLSALFDREFTDYLDQLGRARAHVKARQSDGALRARLLRRLVEDFRLTGQLHYPEHWRQHIQAVLQCDLAFCGQSQCCSGCPLPANNGDQQP